MAEGVGVDNLDPITTVDYLVGVQVETDGVTVSGKVSTSDLVSQITAMPEFSDGLSGSVAAAQAAAATAETAREGAEAALAQARLAAPVSVDSWAVLAAIVPTTIGQTARVAADDVGTHTGRTAASPTVDASGVANSGVYGAYALTAGAWRRDGPLSTTGTASNAQAIAGLSTDVGMTPAADKAALDARFGDMHAVSMTENGIAYAVVDSAGRAAFYVDADGTLRISKFMLGLNAAAADSPTEPLVSRLLAAGMGGFFKTLPPETGYAYAIVDSVGRMILGVPLAGNSLTATVDRALFADNAIAFEGSAANTNFVVTGYVDGGKKRQLRSFQRSTGLVTSLTSLGNNVGARLTSDDKVLFKSDAAGSWRDVYMPAAGGAIWPVEPDPGVIAAFGNSLTQGSGSSGTGSNQGPWPLQLAAATGLSVLNYGIGGQNSSQIAARQGGSPSLLTVSGDTIPASGAVSVTAKTVNLLATGSSQQAWSLTGTLAGVPGSLSTDTSGDYTFTRTAAGSAVACPAGTAFIPDIAAASRTRTMVLEMGRNNYSSQAQVLADIAAAVGYLTPLCKRYIVFDVNIAQNEASGTSAYTTITALNTAIAAAYPNNFLAVFRPPNSAELTALAAMGYTPSAQDLTDIANDTIPTGMRANPSTDLLHLNNYGYALMRMRVQAFLIAKGWL